MRCRGSLVVYDERARVTRWVQLYRASLFRRARRLCGSDEPAHDLVQDTFERALRRCHTFVTATNEQGWLFTILHNCFLDRCRRLAYEQRRLRKLAEAQAIEGPFVDEEAPWQKISHEQLYAAIDRLEPPFAEACRLHVCEQRSYAQISAQLNIPESTVGTRLLRARRQLRRWLEAQVDES